MEPKDKLPRLPKVGEHVGVYYHGSSIKAVCTEVGIYVHLKAVDQIQKPGGDSWLIATFGVGRGPMRFTKNALLSGSPNWQFSLCEEGNTMRAQHTGSCICKRCNSKNEWAEPNQKDGGYICYECR